MVEIPSTSPSVLAAGTASASSPLPAGMVAIQVSVVDLSQALQDITRAIQTSATALTVPMNGNLTLATALGNITVVLPQLSIAEQQVLLDQLVTLVQTQKPLTLALQPGNPPSQATLLLPTTIAPASPSPQPTPVNTGPAINYPPLTVSTGKAFPAIVLPPATALPGPPPATSFLASINKSPVAVLPQVQISSSPPTPSNSPQVTPLAATNALPSPRTVLAPTLSSVQGSTSQRPPAVGPSQQLAVAPSPAPQDTNDAVVRPSVSAPSFPTPAPLPVPSVNPPLNPTSSTPVSPLINLLQPGNEISVRVSQIILSGQPIPTNLAPNQILAVVTGTGTDGQLIVKSGDTTLFVKVAFTSPVGTNLVLTVEPAKAPPLLPLPAQSPLNLQTLPQIVNALTQIDPQTLQQLVATRIPQPNDSLAGTLLLLLGAFKPGNARNWLGDEISDKLIRGGAQGLLDNLSRELSDAGQSTQDAIVGQWKAFPIPLYSQQQFQALTLYVHNESGEQSSSETAKTRANNKVRFLIDMRLTKLGALQIDGFVQSKKLDMILRSENFLPDGLHNALRSSYAKALGAVGFGGTLNFQVGQQFWMRMQKPVTRTVTT
jgi:hypothetical protein